MFKAHYGQCVQCPPGVIKMIVVKSGLCRQHNEQRKAARKTPKEKKPKAFRRKGPMRGQCRMCPENTIGLLATRHYCQRHNDHRKMEEKSKRAARHVEMTRKAKSLPELKKRLWEVFSEYIRLRDSEDGVFTCISCDIPQSASGGNLQAGHYYKSETHPALRYDVVNVNGQCRKCNVIFDGNRLMYEVGLVRRHGWEALADLKERCHDKVELGRFEIELLTIEFAGKLYELKKGNG